MPCGYWGDEKKVVIKNYFQALWIPVFTGMTVNAYLKIPLYPVNPVKKN